MKTKVAFRVFPEGDVIALFPEENGAPGYILSYQHIGQHGDASPELLDELPTCRTEKYMPLYKELLKIGYELEVI